MNELERKASFYLGKIVDPQSGQLGAPLHYDARDLTTHAVCLGMTGSGKTGLCIDLLEEAALDGIPSIIIDPKGDITNMLLVFPDLQPADFLPWINIDDARRKEMAPEAYAEATAKNWAKGLADWGQSPERMRRLKESADFVIFTPGSDAGVQLSILQTLAAPELSWDEHEEPLREKIAGTVSALLELAGVRVESVHSREHVLLSHIFETTWRAGEDLDLAKLILRIQKPPMRKVGVFDVDTYFPPAERMKLAMALNNVLAAPSFENWIEGTPLDIPRIIQAPDGRPRVAIFYIAHLSDTERMFFVTLLLQQVQTWMRTLSGTTSLRCILYFDEVFGYFPPYPADPPSKRPLLTLLKQARAFGLGVVLVTQNPVDLDYKGLANAGTWFIGRMQTERDKMRVLEGLEGVAAQEGAGFDKAYFDRLISALKTRMFILHNVHGEAPAVFYTRWAMSYLRGPLTRAQIRELMKGRQLELPAVSVPTMAAEAEARTKPLAETVRETLEFAPPTLSDKIPQYYLPLSTAQAQALLQAGVTAAKGKLLYEPAAIGVATVRYTHPASGIDMQQQVAYLLRADRIGAIPDWSAAEELSIRANELETRPVAEARFAEVPAPLSDPARVKVLEKNFVDFLCRNRALIISYNPSLKVYARPGESERDFKARCQEAARKARDVEADKVKAKYESRLRALEERIRREERELEEDRAEYEGRKREELLSAGESVFGFLTGRRSSRAISTASRKRRLTQQAKADVEESLATLETLKKELDELNKELEQALAEVNNQWAEKLDDIREVQVTPKRTDVAIEVFGLAWVPQVVK